MKKLLLCLLAAAVLFGSAGCSASPETVETSQPSARSSYQPLSTSPVIALIFAQENSFYSRLQKESEAIAAAAGYEIKAYYSDSDEQQVSDIYSALGEGALAIALVPRNMDNLQDVLDECLLQDVPVVNLMVPVNGTVKMLVCPDYQLMGAKGAKAVKDALGDDTDANVFMLESVEGTFVSQLTHDGFVAETVNLPGVEISYTSLIHPNQDEAYAETKKQLMYDSEINAVFATDESFAQGVLEAVRESGRDIKIVSVGGSGDIMKLVEAGNIYASVFISPTELAQVAMGHVVKAASDPNYVLPQYAGLTVETIFPTDVDKYSAFGDYADSLTNKIIPSASGAQASTSPQPSEEGASEPEASGSAGSDDTGSAEGTEQAS